MNIAHLILYNTIYNTIKQEGKTVIFNKKITLSKSSVKFRRILQKLLDKSLTLRYNYRVDSYARDRFFPVFAFIKHQKRGLSDEKNIPAQEAAEKA